MKFLKKQSQNQKGQALMEYVIVSGLIGILCLGAIKKFGEVIEKRIERMKTEVSRNVIPN